MGFNYHNLGSILPCWVSAGVLYCKLPSGFIMSWKTKLKEDIPEQRNLFRGDTLAFYLKLSSNRYALGRWDKSISVYDEGTDLLVGLSSWECTQHLHMTQVGYYRKQTTSTPIYRSDLDFRTLFVGGNYRVMGLFKEPIKDVVFSLTEMGYMALTAYDADYIIKRFNGEKVTDVEWISESDELWGAGVKVFR